MEYDKDIIRQLQLLFILQIIMEKIKLQLQQNQIFFQIISQA